MELINRQFWQEKIRQAWERRSVIWLAGVRRVGKTYLVQSLPDLEYFDCELPRVRAQLADPESFLRQFRGKRIALDEIHRMPNPSELLKIAADHFPDVKLIATGSSTLAAGSKFRDTLTGRKESVWLMPMTLRDLVDFGPIELSHRLLYGGLPAFCLAEHPSDSWFQDWVDSFWAKDVQELFRLEKRSPFQKFVELLMVQSGTIFEASRFATPSEVSRPTISNFLAVLSETYAATIVKPFTTRKAAEIVSAPKVYCFDTGFISFYRGWTDLRPADCGDLWEHFVLNQIQADLDLRTVNYWRDKRGHEIDFVLYLRRRKMPVAIECKWSSNQFASENLQAFRRQYPSGQNFVVCRDVERSMTRTIAGLEVQFVGLQELTNSLNALI